MSPLLIPILALLIPIVAILSGTYAKIATMKAETAKELGRATGDLQDALSQAQAERDRLRRRLEVVEAIVTSEGYDLDREARCAGLVTDGAPSGRLDPTLLDAEGATDDAPAQARRQRTA